MAVPEQTPYKEYIANGVTKSFPLEFDCENQDHLIVTVNDIEPENGQWSFINGAVVFLIAPANEAKIVIQRNTPLERNTNYQTTNNSFRPQPVNKDFDRIWWKLQELGVTNWLTDTDIKNLSAYVNSLNDETRDEFYNNLGNLEKNTKAMLDEAIKNGAVSALAITTVDTVEELEDLNAWEGRTVSVTSIGNYKYNSSTLTWERDFITDRQVVNINNISELNNLDAWPGRAVIVVNDTYKYINGEWIPQNHIFNIRDFGAVADYDVLTKTILTDSSSAFNDAVIQAKKVSGIVYIPSCIEGKGFYINGNWNLSTSGYTNGIRIRGDGKQSSILILEPVNTAKPVFGGETGAPGNPSNISIGGVTLLAHNKWVGICIQTNGLCLTEFADWYIKDFEVGLDIINDTTSPYGIFTEFVRFRDGHLRANKTQIRFRRLNNGDASFHGVNFDAVNMDGTDEAGMVGIDVGEGCYVYSGSWTQMTIFSMGEGVAIKNAGTRNGFDELYFEGNGRIESTSTGRWETDGRWFVQNDTVSFDDRSTAYSRFVTGNYQTPKINTPQISDIGLNLFRAGSGDNARKKLTRLSGDGVDAFSLNFYSGNTNSWNGTQGLALTYSTKTDSNAEPDGLSAFLTLNRFCSYLQKYTFGYGKTGEQLAINQSGRHTGQMGRYKTVDVPISSSSQTITVTGLVPTSKQSFLLSIDCSANNISYSALFLCSKWDGATTNAALVGVSRSENMPSGISQVFINDSGVNVVFGNAVSTQLIMNLSAVGVGVY